MGKYNYVIKGNTVQVSGFEDSLTIYDLYSWEPAKVNYYRSLLAQKRDMEYANAYLNQMFFSENSTLIDGALINSAIQLLVKCFSNPQEMGRSRLDDKKVFRRFAKETIKEDLTEQFAKFYEARNKVISHDQIEYKNNIVGLVINKENNHAEDIAAITIKTTYLYKQNQEILLKLVKVVNNYIDSQLEKLNKQFINDYNNSVIKPNLKLVRCENMKMATHW
ncbi:MAG: hypothetical protein E7195_09685 [Peptococcaceae bacterium]|nr:hypothetical protein [Peptococcaceae bacterium]